MWVMAPETPVAHLHVHFREAMHLVGERLRC